MDYQTARATLSTSPPLDPACSVVWLRRAYCREPGGGVGNDRGWWDLTAHERCVLTALVLRANAAGVALATGPELSGAGCPRNAQAAAIRRLADAGYLTVVGSKSRRLFVLASSPPPATARPAGWDPSSLHRSPRPRPASAAPAFPAPAKAVPAAAPVVDRAALLARVQAHPLAPELLATLRLAASGQGVERLGTDDANAIVTAVERATGAAPDGKTWVRLRHAIATTNTRHDEEGRPFAANPRRWAGYFSAVFDARSMSGAERAAAALVRASAEEDWERRVADAGDDLAPAPAPAVPVAAPAAPPTPAPVVARPRKRATEKPTAPLVWDSSTVADLARRALS